jgi:hypothetical protein
MWYPDFLLLYLLLPGMVGFFVGLATDPGPLLPRVAIAATAGVLLPLGYLVYAFSAATPEQARADSMFGAVLGLVSLVCASVSAVAGATLRGTK